MTRADLHAHSTASDGQQTPGQLLQLARQAFLDILAITDHDTTAALHDLQAIPGLRIIPAIELGAHDSGHKVDILGYFINIQHHALQNTLADFRRNRLARGQQIVEALGRLGLPLDWERVQQIAGGESVGRPHIARALLEAGHVASIADAFQHYIGDGLPAYVPRQIFSAETAIDLIHQAGGAAVMAHPVYVPHLHELLPRLVPAGLDGIEVNYPSHNAEFKAELRCLADRYKLVMTGGSDFHGLDLPGKAMLGDCLAPEGAVEQLYQRSLRYA